MYVFQIAVSLLTLFFSAAGFVRSFYSDKYSLNVTNLHVSKNRGKYLVECVLVNNSSKPLKISSIEFLSGTATSKPLDFDPAEYDRRIDEAEEQREREEQEAKSASDPFGFSTLVTHPVMPRFHATSEYLFYNPVEFPAIIHSDNDLKASFYLEKLPTQMQINFSKKIILQFKWLIIPVFQLSLSIPIEEANKVKNGK